MKYMRKAESRKFRYFSMWNLQARYVESVTMMHIVTRFSQRFNSKGSEKTFLTFSTTKSTTKKSSDTNLVHSESCMNTMKKDVKLATEDCVNQFLHFQADDFALIHLNLFKFSFIFKASQNFYM